jgi:hypothetical protein
LPSSWKWQQGRASQDVSLPSANFKFQPDRARPAWPDIPAKLPGPEADERVLTWLLPKDKSVYSIEGKGNFDEELANIHLSRETSLSGSTLMVTDSVAWPGGELPADEVSVAKAKAARIGSLKLTLRAPVDTERRYRFAGGADRAELTGIEKAYAKLIADKPDDLSRVSDRARFRAETFDRKGTLSDLDAVIDKQPNANAYILDLKLAENGGWHRCARTIPEGVGLGAGRSSDR